MKRPWGQRGPTWYLDTLHKTLSHTAVIIVDPMLVTGGFLSEVAGRVASRGARSITAVCIIPTVGDPRLQSVRSTLRIFAAAQDPVLNSNG